MTRVGYPSDLFPGPLGASLDLPDGWAPVPVASAAMACRKLDSAHSFAPNIIVRTSSRGIDHSLRTAIAEDDGFTIRAGCNKRMQTCGAKFANIVNFRGFPHIPGQDAVLRYATKDGGHEGSVL